jgi:hypothetical protein
MSGGGQTSTQTTQQILSPEQQNLLNMAMPFATKYAQNQPVLPSGSSVAGFTDPQKAGQTQTLQAGAPGGQLSQEAQNAAGAQSFLTSGASLDPNSNPGLNAAIQGAVRPIEQNFSENIEPAIREGAVGTGQFGGGREGALEGIATQAEQQAIGSTAGQMESANYQNSLDQMTRAMGLTPTVQQASLEPGAATSAVGDVQQQLEQQQLTEAFNKFMFPQTQPLQTAEALSGIAAGIPGGGSTTTGQVNNQMSPLQMAMGFGGLGAGLFGGQGMFGTNGAFSGAPSWLASMMAA